MRRAHLVPLVLVVSSAIARAQSGAPDFTIKVQPTAGTTADEYIVTVESSLKGVDAADRYAKPDFGDFQVVDERTARSTQWSYDPARGQEIHNVETRRYKVVPKRAGKLKIGAAKLAVGGKLYETRDVWVTVTAAANMSVPTDPVDPGTDPGTPPVGPTPDARMARQPTFLFAVADKTKVRVGEQVTVTWLLYTRSDIRRFDPKPPKLDGFWAETLFEPQRYFTYDDADVGGRAYAVAKVSKKALFPTRAGQLVVPPYQAKVGTMSTAFGVPLDLASPPITLDVEPLPPGAPAGFDDAYVGTFALDAKIDRDTVPAGESLSLALTVSGTGAVRRASVPKLKLDGFEVRTPTTFDEQLDTSGDVVRGTRRYVYLLTPTRGGTVPLGPITIPTFDPAKGRYELAQASPLVVDVEGDPSRAARPAASTENVITREIRPLRDTPSITARFGTAAFTSPRFLWMLGLPGALWRASSASGSSRSARSYARIAGPSLPARKYALPRLYASAAWCSPARAASS